ncbi:hypothetical protein C8R46DRAFT_1029273 [Mycena filopes]|nr:hypothetical protein C8R46DRAFT_1029273 [Mycena filopes]
MQVENDAAQSSFSVHLPDKALEWLEAHYEDPILMMMRTNVNMGGPIAAMLASNEPCLVIFGSILDNQVLEAATSLSHLSQFSVMVQLYKNNPTSKWEEYWAQTGPLQPEASESLQQPDPPIQAESGPVQRLRGGASSESESEPELAETAKLMRKLLPRHVHQLKLNMHNHDVGRESQLAVTVFSETQLRLDRGFAAPAQTLKKTTNITAEGTGEVSTTRIGAQGKIALAQATELADDKAQVVKGSGVKRPFDLSFSMGADFGPKDTRTYKVPDILSRQRIDVRVEGRFDVKSGVFSASVGSFKPKISKFRRLQDAFHFLTKIKVPLSELPLYEMVARGWDVSQEGWRMPVYSSLDRHLGELYLGHRNTAYELKVVAHQDAGKERSTDVAGAGPGIPNAQSENLEAKTPTPASSSISSGSHPSWEEPALSVSSSLSSMWGSEGPKTPTQEEPMDTSTPDSPGTSKAPDFQPAFLAPQELVQPAGTEVWRF